eukprot:5875577-Prymnesium_polylepis.1
MAQALSPHTTCTSLVARRHIALINATMLTASLLPSCPQVVRRHPSITEANNCVQYGCWDVSKNRDNQVASGTTRVSCFSMHPEHLGCLQFVIENDHGRVRRAHNALLDWPRDGLVSAARRVAP